LDNGGIALQLLTKEGSGTITMSISEVEPL